MRAVKAFGPEDLRLVDNLPKPSLKKGEVKVAVHTCGVCGSDKWYWQVSGPIEMVAGHEAAGEVIALGEGVQNLKVGDRVAINNVRGCGHCAACKSGQYVRCTTIEHMNYGFSEVVVVPEENCLVLDDSISYEQGCLIFDNWGTPYSAMQRSGIKRGDYVIVSGCGPIGLAAIGLAKLYDVTIIALDPIEYRREAAVKMGAALAITPDETAVEKILAFTEGEGAHIMFECSGKPAAYEIGFQAVRIGGTIVSIGEGAKIHLDVSEVMIRKQLSIVGSFYSTMSYGAEVQELMVKGLIDPLSIVTHRLTLAELPSAFEGIFESKPGILKTIVNVSK